MNTIYQDRYGARLFQQHEMADATAQAFRDGQAHAQRPMAEAIRAEAVKAERARVLAILDHPGAAKHPALAARLVKEGASPTTAAEALNQRAAGNGAIGESFAKHLAMMTAAQADAAPGAPTDQDLWDRVIGIQP